MSTPTGAGAVPVSIKRWKSKRVKKRMRKMKKKKDKLRKPEAKKAPVKKTGKPTYQELIDVQYQSAYGGWKESADSMLGRFFDSGLPANPTKHSKAVWMTLLALYILDSEFPAQEP